MMGKTRNILAGCGVVATLGVGVAQAGLPSFDVPSDVLARRARQESAAEPKTGQQAKPRLVIENTGVQAGRTFNLGIHFELDKGWHLYWPGQNDAGLPIKVELKLPPGWKAGPIQWPAPVRLIDAGDILDHVYFNRVTLIVPIEVPSSEQPGASRSITARLDWLVCDKVCEKGGATVNLELPLLASSAPLVPSKDAPLFETARRSLPKPLPSDGRITAEVKDGRLKIIAKGAKSLAFYPRDSSTRLRDPIGEAAGDAGSLDMELKPATPEEPAVVGVLEISAVGKDKSAEFFAINIPVLKRESAPSQPKSPQSGKP